MVAKPNLPIQLFISSWIHYFQEVSPVCQFLSGDTWLLPSS